MSFICEFCNNSYRTKNNLLNHQKTAKFCIELRNKTELEHYDNKSFSCEKCLKNFTRKDTLEKHISICKIIVREKIENTINNYELENNKLRLDIEILKKQLSNSLEEINKIKNENIVLNISLNLKNEIIKDLNEKYNILLDKNNDVIKFAVNKPTSTTNINNVTYNSMVNDLIPFTDINIKKSISTITRESLLFNSDNVIRNFINSLVNVLKDMAMCTDVSRGVLLVKNDRGITRKMISNEFILECFEKAPDELLKICDEAMEFVRLNEKKLYGDVEQLEIMCTIQNLINTIKQKKPNDTVKNISSTIVKYVKQYSKKHETSSDTESGSVTELTVNEEEVNSSDNLNSIHDLNPVNDLGIDSSNNIQEIS
jgi:hypothetical protein